MTVSDNTIIAESWGDFFKNLCKKALNSSKKMSTKLLKDPSRASKFGANFNTAFASRSPKAALSSLPKLTREKDYISEIMFDFFLPSKFNKKQQSFTHQHH